MVEIGRLILKFTRISRDFKKPKQFRKRTKLEDSRFLISKLYFKGTVVKMTWYWHKDIHTEKLKSVAQLCLTLCNPWTVAHQAPFPMEFSKQEYWSWLACPSPGDPPNPGTEPRSPTLQILYCLSHQGRHKDRPVDQWNKIESPEIQLHTHGQLIFNTDANFIQWEKDSLFNK